MANLCRQNPTVRDVYSRRGDLVEVVQALVKRVKTLELMYAKLMRVSPFKVYDKRGNLVVWRCQEKDIPLRGVDLDEKQNPTP